MHTLTIGGEEVPSLGFGTWRLAGEQALEGVRHALELGYRHIDTAQMYDNEQEVGDAIAGSGIPRDELFLTTKVARRNAAPPDVHRSTEDSLRRLGTDHVDLLLLHWPTDAVPLPETLGAMGQLVEAGKVRHIGVSNFTPSLVRQAVKQAEIFANQVEYHPFLDQTPLLRLAAEHDHMLTAYSPVAKGRVVDEPVLREIGEGYGKTPAQVALRWLVQQEHVSAIPRSSTPEHRAANFDIFDFSLTDPEMERIAGLARAERLVDPAWVSDWED